MPISLDTEDGAAVDRHLPTVRQALNRRLAQRGGETTVTLKDLNETIHAPEEIVESAMVVLANQAQNVDGVTVVRSDSDDGPAWEVSRDD